MAAGQSELRSTLDVGAVDAVEARLAVREAARHASHADALRDALELNRLYEAAGMGLGVPAQLALVWRCSETRALTQLNAALVLVDLPGALEALESAVMTAEQAAAVARVLEPLGQPVRDAVWARAAGALAADVNRGVQRPPARLAEQLKKWAVEVDPSAAERRRQQAEQQSDVLFRQRDDNLVDLVLSGLTMPLAEACLSRISAGAAPFGAGDERTAGQRRLDSAVDLLLGRTGRPAAACPDGHGSCDCPLGAPAPCGSEVVVLVPLATSLDVGDVPAEVAGRGPIEPDLLAALLTAGPVLRAVWVGSDGVPVSAPPRVERPARGDLAGVREALRRLVEAGPGLPHPRHPDDHAGPGEQPDHPPDEPPDDPPADGPPGDPPPDPDRRRPQLHRHAHPPDTPGPYRVPSRLQRFLKVRAPRCEWPGCGARASRCDLDHDLAWPHGATCACNVGPLCRRHHRIKQLGWHKQRTAEGVLWTSPTGRTTLSPHQHDDVPLPRELRPQPADPLAGLSPSEREEQLWSADPTDLLFDGLDDDDPGLGGWRRAEAAAEERWWVRELAALRRQVHATPQVCTAGRGRPIPEPPCAEHLR